MANREVTELDFRMPEFRDAKVEDYEFRGDGKLVRKDRWETAVGSIRFLVGISGRSFEIPEVVEAVRAMATQFEGWTEVHGDTTDPEDLPLGNGPLEVKLEDGSILRNAQYLRTHKTWLWNDIAAPLPVVAWRTQRKAAPAQ